VDGDVRGREEDGRKVAGELEGLGWLFMERDSEDCKRVESYDPYVLKACTLTEIVKDVI
jgi:hypothetical protein